MDDSSNPRRERLEAKGDYYYGFDRSALLDFMAANLTLSGRALDVGCAEGVFGAALLARGFQEVVGIEPVPRVAARACQRLSRVITATFDSATLEEFGTFDLVVFADSLEHMLDPWGALYKAKALVKPDGALLLSVPNVSHWSVLGPALAKGRWDYTEAGLLDRTHLRFFTPSTLREALEVAGFTETAQLVTERQMRRRHRPIQWLLRILWPHTLVYQQYVIAIPRLRDA